MELKIGNKYKVLKRLGKGAFGDIYAGVNIKTNEEVAIKLVRYLFKSTHLCHQSFYLCITYSGCRRILWR